MVGAFLIALFLEGLRGRSLTPGLLMLETGGDCASGVS